MIFLADLNMKDFFPYGLGDIKFGLLQLNTFKALTFETHWALKDVRLYDVGLCNGFSENLKSPKYEA